MKNFTNDVVERMKKWKSKTFNYAEKKKKILVDDNASSHFCYLSLSLYQF